ncbi:MAG: methyltransferase domain-containing protein [bacterium]|nr:methyltransferase domain-containing protein [bacterium]
MEVNPNITPKGISLEEIREIAKRNSDEVRLFKIDCRGHKIPIVALPGVYFSENFGDSQYFAEKVPDFVNGRFLEIGAGTGIVVIATALKNGEYFIKNLGGPYVAIDINPQAVKNAIINAMINDVGDAIDVIEGDVFDPLSCVEDKFDRIFWAHPFHRGSTYEDIFQRACFDPLFQGLKKYVKDGYRLLNKGGKLLLGSGNFADLDEMRKIMNKYGCAMNLLDYIHRPFNGKCGELNTYNIYEIRRK